MSKTSFTLQANENDVMDGINSILNLLEMVNQDPFPRNIMCASYSGAFTVYDVRQMYCAFKKANFQDCRISAYPPIFENTKLIPNLILLDIGYDHHQVQINGVQYADKLNKTLVNKLLKRLQNKEHICNFMVMHTGNGRHIILPFLFDTPLEYVEELNYLLPSLMSSGSKKVNNIIGQHFLSFAKKYFSNGLADPLNYPKFSNIFLRVPGSINMKMKYGSAKIVRIEHECDYDNSLLPGIGDFNYDNSNVMSDFVDYLCLIDSEKQDRFRERYTNSSSKKSTLRARVKRYNWIELLHDTAISDCRKRALWLIMAPYAINVKQMSAQQAFTWIKDWMLKCEKERLHTGIDLRDYDEVNCEICNKFLGRSAGYQADMFDICCKECSESIIFQQKNQ
jgi:hypothetical protein